MDKNTTLIYVASPYTSHEPDELVKLHAEETNYMKAIFAVGLLMQKGFMAYSPIVHWHVVDVCFKGDIGYEDYLATDLEFLQRCDELHVLKVAGWEKSVGVQVEINHALKFNKPIKYFAIEGSDLVYGGNK